MARCGAAMTQRFVLDASVVLAWVFDDDDSGQADGVEDLLQRTEADVPSHFHVEVAGAILRGEREQRLRREDVQEIAIGIEGLPCVVDPETSRRVFHDALELARKYGLTIYDAAYLELAIRRKIRLATVDKRLNTAAMAENVAMLKLAPEDAALSHDRKPS